MPSLFSKIIAGDIPSHKILEDARFYAFLDINPVRPGHTLVVPKPQVDYLFDLDDDLLGQIMIFARPIAKALEQVVACARVGVMVAGLEVPHAHVHLIPISSIGDLNFANAKPADPATLANLATKVRAALQA